MALRRVLPASVVVAACLLVTSPAGAAEQRSKIAGLSVTIWSRDARPSEHQPTIIFSHGFRGCATQSRFLMEAFAEAGYLVIAPNHHDAACQGGGASRMGRSDAPFQKPDEWNDGTYRDRADDIRRLIDALRNDVHLPARADLGRLALAGHSLGGYTVLGLAGAWPSWKLSGVKAVLALSPYSQPYDRQRTLWNVGLPVMYQGGTRDFGVTPSLHKAMGAYDLTPDPKYYVEFKGATHFAWTNLGSVAHESIAAYSVAFMNHYVKGDAASALLTQTRADVAVYRYSSELGRSDSASSAGGARHGRLPERP
jgi:predicted dienelactone hydrolase